MNSIRTKSFNQNKSVKTALSITLTLLINLIAMPITSFSAETQTPWQTNVEGYLATNMNWQYVMGYHFTPLIDGQVTQLGGYFNGTKTVKLFNKTTGALLASTTVTATNTWGYSAITPVDVQANTAYTVAVYLNGTGGSVRYQVNPPFPRTYADIRIEGSTYAYTGINPNIRPTYTIPYHMYGQADIVFQTATADSTPPVISSVTTSELFSTATTITWTTDEPASSQIDYGATLAYGQTTPLDIAQLTGHQVAIWDLTPEALHHFRVRSKDAAGNEAISGDFTFTTTSDNSGTGSIFREYWQGISGVIVSNLTSHPNYPNNATGSTSPTLFEGPVNWTDNYGTRMRGYVHPPTSGSYTFWISGDDYCELWLSSTDNPVNKTLIASVPGWTSSRLWHKYAQQKSSPIMLTGGQKYYIEALHKEGGGGDSIAVGWQFNNTTMERPIPGSRLSPWVNVISDTTPPTGSVVINSAAALSNSTSVTLTLSATDDSGVVNEMQFSNDNVSYSAPQTYTTSVSWTLSSGDGAKTVYAKFKDAAGNWSNAVSDTITLDTTPPAITFTSPTDGQTLGAE